MTRHVIIDRKNLRDFQKWCHLKGLKQRSVLPPCLSVALLACLCVLIFTNKLYYFLRDRKSVQPDNRHRGCPCLYTAEVHTGLFCQNKSFIQKIQSLKLRTRGAATEHVETRRGGAQRHTDDKARLLREFRATASSAELVTLLPSLSKRHQPAWCPTPQRAKLFTPSCSGRSIIDADSSNKTLTSDQSVQRPLMFKSARHSDRYRPYACSDTTKA